MDQLPARLHEKLFSHGGQERNRAFPGTVLREDCMMGTDYGQRVRGHIVQVGDQYAAANEHLPAPAFFSVGQLLTQDLRILGQQLIRLGASVSEIGKIRVKKPCALIIEHY